MGENELRFGVSSWGRTRAYPMYREWISRYSDHRYSDAGVNGLEVCKYLYETRPETQVIILTKIFRFWLCQICDQV